MHVDHDKWLTINEVVQKNNFNDIEARRIVNKFGKFLAPRNFGDIVKYSPAAVEAIILIGKLYQQGYASEEISAILSRQDPSPKDLLSKESLHDQLKREVNTLLLLQNQACQLLRSTFEMMQNLMSDVTILTAKLTAAEEEIKNLKAEQQHCGAGVDGQRLEQLKSPQT
jgi:DNA-binding transcriptional MerR regulator